MLSQIVTASHKRNRGKPPIAYTEHGAVMAANILRSARAIAMSIELEELETRVIGRLDRHDHEIEILFRIMATLIEKDGEKAPGRRRVGSA